MRSDTLPEKPADWAGLLALEPRLLMQAAPLVKVRILDASVVEGDAGTTVMSFTVRRNGKPQVINKRQTKVRFVTEELSGPNAATEGVDYERAQGRIRFRKGERTQTINVTVNGDTDVEGDEVFNVLLTKANPRAVIARGEAQGTILEDDATLSINDVSVLEGDAGTTNLVFTVTLSAASPQTVTVDYATSDDTATAGVDYVADSGTVTFAPGETSQQITITINGDTDIEPDETFNVTLSNAANASLADPLGVGTIQNDD